MLMKGDGYHCYFGLEMMMFRLVFKDIRLIEFGS